MIFGKKKIKSIEAHNLTQRGQDYWSIVRRQFYKKRLAVWALRVLFVLIFIAIFADFIANDKPLYCKTEAGSSWPVFKQHAINLGLTKGDETYFRGEWKTEDYISVWWPLIPYSAESLDSLNNQFISPFAEQDVPSIRHRHWFGTDKLGRDIAAGIIAGTRTALLVGIIAMTIAAFIGIFIGGIAGYFGDERMLVSRVRLIMNFLALIGGIFYAFIARSFYLGEYGIASIEGLKSIAIFFGILIGANIIASFLKRIPFLSKKVKIPIDLLLMRLIEVFNAIPGLLFILALMGIFKNSSIFNVMIIIGLIAWTGIARFLRGELLRVRSLNYIESAQAMGFSDFRILLKHALPNALTPVLISIVFGIAGAILIEAFLSFLGLYESSITWGSMLNEAKNSISNTTLWLAIFPGIAIFITITTFNLIGESLSDAMDPKLNQHDD